MSRTDLLFLVRRVRIYFRLQQQGAFEGNKKKRKKKERRCSDGHFQGSSEKKSVYTVCTVVAAAHSFEYCLHRVMVYNL